MSATQPSSESEPPPLKKLKQSTLTFHTTTQLDSQSSTSSTSHTDLEDTSILVIPHPDTCTAECCARASDEEGLTLFQPKDSSTIELTRRKQGRKTRFFSPTWYVTYPWITLCTTRARVFCVYCRYCVGNGLCLGKKEDAFISNGFDNWKKAHERFTQHTQSDLHKESILKVELLKQDSVSTLNKQAMVEQKQHRDQLLRQLSSLRFLLRQGLAVRGHEDLEGNLLQLLMLRSDDCPDLNCWIRERKYFSPAILNEQIALMGLSLLRKLLSDIRSAEFFSVIADEATDISNKEQMTVCIRWVDEDFLIHEDPVELVHLPKTDSNTPLH